MKNRNALLLAALPIALSLAAQNSTDRRLVYMMPERKDAFRRVGIGGFQNFDAALAMPQIVEKDRGAPASVAFNQLASWHHSADPGVKCFSGTATYHKTIDAPRTGSWQTRACGWISAT